MYTFIWTAVPAVLPLKYFMDHVFMMSFPSFFLFYIPEFLCSNGHQTILLAGQDIAGINFIFSKEVISIHP